MPFIQIQTQGRPGVGTSLLTATSQAPRIEHGRKYIFYTVCLCCHFLVDVNNQNTFMDSITWLYPHLFTRLGFDG